MPSLDFKGKQFIYTHHLSVPFRTLEIDPKKSLPAKGQKPSLDDNLIIHGDNLHALKALLPTYAGRIDCIYIDPPYNTGTEDWIYNDAVNSPLMREWVSSHKPVDKEDLERHDKWLCMMWPRLKVLRDLLAENGTILVSCDENEVARLRLIIEEIFSEQSYVTTIIWKSRQHLDSRALSGLSVDHEYILVAAKSPDTIEFVGQERDQSKYSNPDNDPRGPWMSRSMLGLANADQRPNLHYDLVDPRTKTRYSPPPDTGWRYSPQTMKQKVEDDRILFPSTKSGRPREKVFLAELKKARTNLSSVLEGVYTAQGTQEIREIFGSEVFPFPKPSELIVRLLAQVAGPNSIVLDSFAGSGTTAHAVLRLNKADGGSRRFILVECEQYADTLTAERVRRVVRGYQFSGVKREVLTSQPLTLSSLKHIGDLLSRSDGYELTDGHRFDRISKTIENGVFKVFGEKQISSRCEGLGGCFAYCELGPEISVEEMLTGKKLPDYASLARYVFYTATGKTLEKDVTAPRKDWFIGETEAYRLHLIYKPDKDWLRTNESALNSSTAELIAKSNPTKKRSLVFAAVKYVGQKELLAQYGIEFCQLPYAIHRILGD